MKHEENEKILKWIDYSNIKEDSVFYIQGIFLE